MRVVMRLLCAFYALGMRQQRGYPLCACITNPSLRGDEAAAPSEIAMDLRDDFGIHRRAFLVRSGLGLGATAIWTLLHRDASGSTPAAVSSPFKGILSAPHFAPRAKRIIYLFMSGGPS